MIYPYNMLRVCCQVVCDCERDACDDWGLGKVDLCLVLCETPFTEYSNAHAQPNYQKKPNFSVALLKICG